MPELFNELKDMMLNHEKDHLRNLIPYYETLWQHRDKLKELTDEISKWESIGIQYECDQEDYYTEGTIIIQFYKDSEDRYTQPDFHYDINLLHDQRYWGYCECNENDEDYNILKKCCGDGCDWVVPQISVNKINKVVYESFDGVEKDLWELEDKWKEYLSDHKEKVRQEELDRLENHLEQTKLDIKKLKENK